MKQKCPECGSENLDCQTYKGECHCRQCGLVIEDSMPDRNHYRTGTSKAGTQFVNGKYVTESWTLTSKQKNIQKARKRLGMIASKLRLPDYAKEQAYSIYKEAVNRDLCVGRDSRSILFACVYAVCHQNGISKTVVEITEYSDVTPKKLLRAYKVLQSRLKLKPSTCDPVDLMPRFVSKLNLSHKTMIRATQIIDRSKGTSAYSGKNPKSLIAAAIYIAAKQNKEKITQRELANEIGVMEVTIRRRYKEIVDTLKISF